MAYVSYDTTGRETYRYEPAWVREVSSGGTKARPKVTYRYEVWQNSRLIATKYTKVSAANLAKGLNKLMKD
jgi:hypothetical protein